MPGYVHVCTCIMYCIPILAADSTFSANPGKEKVRNTIIDEAAMTAPSPASLRVMLSGRGPAALSNCW